jgi:hypothetical protein
MKITIEATPKEVAEMLQAIASSQEQKVISVAMDTKQVSQDLSKAIRGIRQEDQSLRY